MVSFVLREVESSKIESLRKGAFSLAGKGVFLTHLVHFTPQFLTLSWNVLLG